MAVHMTGKPKKTKKITKRAKTTKKITKRTTKRAKKKTIKKTTKRARKKPTKAAKPTKSTKTIKRTKRIRTPVRHPKPSIRTSARTITTTGTGGMRVLLDANFLMIPGKFKVDVFRELQMFGRPELFTLDKVVKELEKIARDRSQDSTHARMGLFLIDSRGINIVRSRSGSTDKELGRIGKDGDYTVCTQDRALIKILRKMGVKVISLRQRKYLVRI